MSMLALLTCALLANAPALAAEPLPSEVAAVLTHAEQQGLPTGPLEAKALEGLAKGVPPVRIAQALGRMEASMAATAAALGDRLSTTDPAGHLAAGGAALTGGSSEAALRSLADQATEHRVIATRTYADLLATGFSEPQALGLVGSAARGAEPQLALSGLSTTASSLVSGGLSPTLVTEQLHENHAGGNGRGNAYGLGGGPPEHSNAGGNGNGPPDHSNAGGKE